MKLRFNQWLSLNRWPEIMTGHFSLIKGACVNGELTISGHHVMHAYVLE